MNQFKHPAAKLLGISIEALNMELTLKRISGELEGRRKGYICMAGVHGIMEAHRNAELAAIYAGSSITVPDGTPTVWVGRWEGHKAMQRVAGPDLMLEVFRRKQFAAYTHFLYGGEEHVAEELRERFTQRFPWARIVGTYTPPFRDLNAEEEESLIARIRELKPDIIWVGISTPRQERFMHRYLHRLDTTLMFGVASRTHRSGSRPSACNGCIGSCRIRVACGSGICATIRRSCGISPCNSVVCGSTRLPGSLICLPRSSQIMRYMQTALPINGRVPKPSCNS
jgi:N-acetylglucosaminyldiphosphoundecaprenol N-acetyl-beta-D-mannosaminyltransferase